MRVAADDDIHKDRSKSRKTILYAALALGLVAVVAGVVVAVTGGKSESSSPVAAPTPAAPTTPGPTPQNAFEVKEFIDNAARSGGAEFIEPNSYQSRARTWVMTQDLPAPDIPLGFEAQTLQLYALACVYYNTYSTRSAWTDFHFGVDVALPGWFSNRGWLGEANNVCNWYGITCNNSGAVEKLELDTNGLTGYFPPEAALLHDSLQYLDLYNNLVHNKGDIGNSFLGELTKLEYLFYGTTNFEYDGVPTEIGLLTNLKEYDFSYSLYFGELEGSTWSKLSNLNYLVMDGNAYNSSFPQEFLEMPSLEYLYAGFSFLEGDLSFVSEMPKIFELWIDDNPGLAGPIPKSLTDTETLVSLSVTNCGLTGTIPTELGLMTDMIQMWFYDNKLTGTVPTEFGDLIKMKVLNVQKNDLTGEMPSEICTRRSPFGRLEELEADCDSGEIVCDSDCCTCCGESCIDV
jgi:hypothetical protein